MTRWTWMLALALGGANLASSTATQAAAGQAHPEQKGAIMKLPRSSGQVLKPYAAFFFPKQSSNAFGEA
jgi:hypothetical protein